MMQFVAPFLINFGINKAMGMSTGKALGMAGINSFLPGGGATSEGAGGIGGLLYQGGGNMQQLALEGGKTLVSGMAAKKYGLGGGLAAYGGLSGLQGAAGYGVGGEGLTGIEGAKSAFMGVPENQLIAPPMKPEGLGVTTPGAGNKVVPTPKVDPKTAGEDKPGGLFGLGTGGTLALGAAAVPLLGTLGGGDDEEQPRGEKVNLNYPTVKDIVTRFKIRDYGTGQDKQLDIGETPEERLGSNYVSRYKEGGIAQFNTGALVNRLPSKTQYDETDYSIYKRAANFVTDESGNGDEDEDTMLAQLADGEFVTTAKAVLGAGIIAGANPSDKNSMRNKGAKYFYEQQARFKRVYKLLNEAKKRINTVQ
jgi:hypothetical protein